MSSHLLPMLPLQASEMMKAIRPTVPLFPPLHPPFPGELCMSASRHLLCMLYERIGHTLKVVGKQPVPHMRT